MKLVNHVLQKACVFLIFFYGSFTLGSLPITKEKESSSSSSIAESSSIAAAVKMRKRLTAQKPPIISTDEDSETRKKTRLTSEYESSSSRESSSHDNYSDDLDVKEVSVDIDKLSPQELEEFFSKQNEKMHSICQKPDHHLYDTITQLNDILIECNALLQEKIDFIKKFRKEFSNEITIVNLNINKILEERHKNLIKQYSAEIQKYSLNADNFSPVSLEPNLLQPSIQLGGSDKTKVIKSAEKIIDLLHTLCEQSNTLISSSNNSARLGTMKHRYCQSLLEGIQQTHKFKGIESLTIESSHKGQSVLEVEQKPDIYWMQGGIIFDFKFGERGITPRDKVISSQILPHYMESYQLNL